MTQPFSRAATVYFYSPHPDGSVDLSQGAINVPVLPGIDVRVRCQVLGVSTVSPPFDLIGQVGGMRTLLDIIRQAGPDVQWYSPHARSVLARYVQWAVWQEQLEYPEMSTWSPSLSFLDPIQELNRPAYMSLQDRQAWSPTRVLQLFPNLLPTSHDQSRWPMGDPWVAATVWHNLSLLLHSHAPCPNLAT